MLTLLYVPKTYNPHMTVYHELLNLERERFEANARKFLHLFHIAKKENDDKISKRKYISDLPMEYNQDEDQEPKIKNQFLINFFTHIIPFGVSV
jgi:hypothetical protein